MATRRSFLRQSTAGAAVLGAWGPLSPLAAIARDDPEVRPLEVLSKQEARLFDAWCDVLAIGARAARVSRFLDKYLSASFGGSLLMLRYLANPPLADFYLRGIAGIEAESNARFSASFVDLNDADKKAVVDAAATFSTQAWQEPVPPFFYFVSRSDAVDVVYGTEDGFRDLQVPYLAHIKPPSPW